MHQPYKEDTKQERYLAEALEKCGYSFVTQCDWFDPYIVDFYLPELCMVIEADGHYGHSRKRDVKRDMDLMAAPMVEYILHIKSKSLKDITDELWLALNKYQAEELVNQGAVSNPLV
jgi:very-short-patch-repair endonuclease